MMTSLVTDRPRGTREKVLPAAPQAAQIQATAEQIRLAQVIYDGNDTVFEDKVKQLMEVTGKNQDECMVALHDCNEDANRAINFLLEGSSDTNSWETVGKKRGLPKEGSSSDKENKDGREKRGERDAGRGRGGPSRRGRGAVRSREVCLEENGVDLYQGERGADRGRRGRGRASGGRGRGRAAGGSKFSSQGMGTFHPAEYTTDSSTAAGGSRSDDWETAVTDAVDGRGAWTVPQDDWATDDWAEDLSETKVFTASSVPTAENHIPSGDSVDMEGLLLKPVDGRESEDMGCVEPSSSQNLAHSLVFTNSHHPHTNPTSYAHATLSSVLGSGFGNLGSSKLPLSAQMLEQQKGPGIGPLSAEQAVSGGSSGSVGVSGALEVENPVPTSSWEAKPPVSQNTTVLSSPFGRDYKVQPEPSRVLSQLAQRQPNSLPQVQPAAPPTAPATSASSFESFSKPQDASSTHNGPSPVAKLSLPAGLPPPQEAIMQHKLKTQKRKIPPTSKIPLSAVEMPGSADVSGLNVQFGALDFGPEPSLPDFSHPDNGSSGITSSNRDPVPVSQPLNSHYSKSPSEPLGSPQSLPMSTSDSSYSSPSASLSTLPSSLPLSQTISAASHSSSSGSTFDTNGPPHPHLTFSQGKEPTTSSVTNSFDCVRTSTALETAVASPAKPDCPQSSVSSSARPPVLLSSSAPSLSSELPTLSSQVTNLLSNCTLTSSPSFTNTSVNAHSASVCVLSSAPAPPGASAVSVTSAVHGTAVTGSALGMSSNGAATLPGCRSTPLLQSSSGKAPPNLAQGVPPLLPSQYIMGPGGLLPAYPQIYGYEDLQMLQSRLPMDYYGVTFPGPAASLTGRDGSLSNSPYSGEMTKFGRGDSASPAPSTSLSAPPPPQAQQPLQSQAQQQPPGHHGGQQAFLNPALPPGYSYTGLPYYPGLPGMPSAFQYGPMFVSPASAKQHGVGLNTPSNQFQQASAYGQHAYGSGFDDLTQGPAGGEYGKGAYGSSTQTQAKSAATGPGKGISVSSSNAVGPDLSATVYNKAQSFDKQGFHTGTPPPFNLPSALGGAGPLNPGSGPGYAPAPFLHILPAHQQPHSQLLHHHHAQDSQGSSSQRSQSSSIQQKNPANKSTYGSSAYWGN